MKSSSKYIDKAVEAFRNLPGVGQKTALRYVLHLIKSRPDLCNELITAATDIRDKLQSCSTCGNYADERECSICTSRHRKHDTVCIVESVRDLMAIEETSQFNGTYHVLGGVISPLEGIGPENLRLLELVDRVREKDIRELIMAISPTIEGETTIYYISNLLKEYDVNISIIARGVSFGGELEYADELTLGRSILSRTPYQNKLVENH